MSWINFTPNGELQRLAVLFPLNFAPALGWIYVPVETAFRSEPQLGSSNFLAS